jgi:hypothetical protein
MSKATSGILKISQSLRWCGLLAAWGGSKMTSPSIDIEGDLIARVAQRKDVAQSARVCLTELVGRGNSEAIASRSLFAVDL